MPTANTVDELNELVAALAHCVTALESTYGDTSAMRRVANDAQKIGNGIRRLEIDLEELSETSAFASRARPAEMIQIADTDYDAEFWRDVDHEGVGAQSLACPPVSPRG